MELGKGNRAFAFRATKMDDGIQLHLSEREGLARALPQAMAAGKPVIAFDSDGANEVCLDNQTGFLVPAGDLHGLTDRLAQLAQDPGLREQLGRRGRALVRESFSVEKMVEELYSLYRRLLARVRQPGTVP